MAEARRLMKGNDAIAEAAVRAGCGAYFGYPITPQNELIAYMAKRMLELGRIFIQAESETAAINMVFGASAAGARAMTSSSGPGISLKQEGISYAAGADIPMVIVNVQRAGPGLGSISPNQGDYFQATRGGGHGDYHTVVLAPKSVQEAADLTYLAFDLADAYRIPVVVLADGLLGQMMEGVVLPSERDTGKLPDKTDWTVGRRAGTGREPHRISSLDLVPESLEAKIRARWERYGVIREKEVRCESIGTDDAELVLVAYGTCARVCQGAVKEARKRGTPVGLFRPITLWPFPSAKIAALAAAGKRFLVVEMNMGQMVEDVRLAAERSERVAFYGRTGGSVPTEDEVLREATRLLEE